MAPNKRKRPGPAKKHTKSEPTSEAESLHPDILSLVVARLRHSPALHVVKCVSTSTRSMVDRQLSLWENNNVRVDIRRYANNECPYAGGWLSCEGEREGVSSMHDDARRLHKLLRLLAHDHGVTAIDNATAAGLGWRLDDCDEYALAKATCPALLQKSLRDALLSQPSLLSLSFSRLLWKPTRFLACARPNAEQIVELDLGDIQSCRGISLSALLVRMHSLKELRWLRCKVSELLVLPAPHALHTAELVFDCKEVDVWRGVAHLQGLTALSAAIQLPHHPTRFDMTVVLSAWQQMWDKHCYSPSDMEQKDGFEPVRVEKENASHDYLLTAIPLVKDLTLWNTPEKLFYQLAMRGRRLRSLQLGTLSPDRSRLCNFDSFHQALCFAQQPAMEGRKVDIHTLRLRLHAVPVVNLDYYLPHLMNSLNEQLWCVRRVDVVVHSTHGSSMAGSWSLHGRNAQKRGRLSHSRLKQLSLHIDGYVVLTDLDFVLPPSLESLSISLFVPTGKAVPMLRSVAELIRRLGDVNKFPELAELNLQIYGVACCEMLLHTVCDELSDLRRLSIDAAPTGDKTSQFHDLMRHVVATCCRLEKLSLGEQAMKLAVGEKRLIAGSWRNALAVTGGRLGMADTCELAAAVVMPRLQPGEQYHVRNERHPLPCPRLEEEEEEETAPKYARSSDDDDEQDEDGSFVANDLDEVSFEEESEDELDRAERMLTKERRQRRKDKGKQAGRVRRVRLESAGSAGEEEPSEREIHDWEGGEEEEEERDENSLLDLEAEEASDEEESGEDEEEPPGEDLLSTDSDMDSEEDDDDDDSTGDRREMRRGRRVIESEDDADEEEWEETEETAETEERSGLGEEEKDDDSFFLPAKEREEHSGSGEGEEEEEDDSFFLPAEAMEDEEEEEEGEAYSSDSDASLVGMGGMEMVDARMHHRPAKRRRVVLSDSD